MTRYLEMGAFYRLLLTFFFLIFFFKRIYILAEKLYLSLGKFIHEWL